LQAEVVVSDYLAKASQEPEDDCVGGEGVCIKKRCQRLAVEHVRATVGLVTENEANRKMVTKLVLDYIKGRGMRPSHISFYAPVAIELCFVPTEQDVLAQAVRRSSTKAHAKRRLGLGSLCK